ALVEHDLWLEAEQVTGAGEVRTPSLHRVAGRFFGGDCCFDPSVTEQAFRELSDRDLLPVVADIDGQALGRGLPHRGHGRRDRVRDVTEGPTVFDRVHG